MDLFERAAGRPERSEEPEVALEGTVERVVFAGRNGEFTVARLKVEGAPEPVTIVGSLLGIRGGEQLRGRGRRESNPRFGPKVRVTSYPEVAPATVEGIKRCLGS